MDEGRDGGLGQEVFGQHTSHGLGEWDRFRSPGLDSAQNCRTRLIYAEHWRTLSDDVGVPRAAVTLLLMDSEIARG